jgi:transketolase N-terminal domain/subunit
VRMDRHPTEERWESFGWKVVAVEDRKYAA